MTETIRLTYPQIRRYPGSRSSWRSVTKRYPGQKAAAVDNVSLTVPAGEIVVFVGPSGCGKTTTMRMINRLIEPTSGKITIDGKDALSIDPDKLRRGIGYSIQQAGLFPHFTIAKERRDCPGSDRLGQETYRSAHRRDARPRRPRSRYLSRPLPSPIVRRGSNSVWAWRGRWLPDPSGAVDGRTFRCRRSDHPRPAPGRTDASAVGVG